MRANLKTIKKKEMEHYLKIRRFCIKGNGKMTNSLKILEIYNKIGIMYLF